MQTAITPGALIAPMIMNLVILVLLHSATSPSMLLAAAMVLAMPAKTATLAKLIALSVFVAIASVMVMRRVVLVKRIVMTVLVQVLVVHHQQALFIMPALT